MKKGFTLVEILVAMALFTIIVAIAVGSFVNALRTQRNITGILTAQSSASAALEQMAREMRTGRLFCTKDDGVSMASACGITDPTSGILRCSGTQGSALPGNEPWMCTSYIQFWPAKGGQEIYQLVDGAIERDGQPITGSGVEVKYLNFTLYGQLLGDHMNPRVTISLGVAVSSTDPGLASDVLNLQTTVSARQQDSTSTSPYY